MEKKVDDKMLEQILARYSAGEKTRKIAQDFGIDQAYVSHLANKNGLRRTDTYKKGAKSGKQAFTKCGSCGKQNPAEACFCMFCGKDVRSEKMIVTESIERLRNLVACLPAHMQSEADEITRRVLQYLRKA